MIKNDIFILTKFLHLRFFFQEKLFSIENNSGWGCSKFPLSQIRISISNGLIDKSFGKYINRKEVYDISSSITVKSIKYCYYQSHKHYSICKAFSYLTAIHKLDRHSALKKNQRWRNFDKMNMSFFLIFITPGYPIVTIQSKELLYIQYT